MDKAFKIIRDFLLCCLIIVILIQLRTLKTRIQESYNKVDTTYVLHNGFRDTVLIKHSIPQYLK